MERMEETSFNLDSVKTELQQEDECGEKQNKIDLTFENRFGKNLIERRNNGASLIGFSDSDVIMKIERDCNKCGRNYDRYCLNCSSLSHILNNSTPNLHPELDLNTIPVNMFEIDEIAMRLGVFALKTIPKGVTLGPFEGITPVRSAAGLLWKIENGKFVNNRNGNWMTHIATVTNHSLKNLNIFQIDGILYFETSREIEEGEELLAYYSVDNKEEEFYLIPVKKEEYPKVFACTLCCLGFSLEKCLVEHKSKCPQGDRGGSIKDFEIIQCSCCKVWLEKQEYLQGGHKLNCLENYNRLRHNVPKFQGKTEEDEISTRNDRNKSYSTQTSCYGNDKTNKKEHQLAKKQNLKIHLSTHTDDEQFQCDTCPKKFSKKNNLDLHIRNQHSSAIDKRYKCSKCSYQTNKKGHLTQHLNTHRIIKLFQCDFCKKRFSQKGNLNIHVENVHSNTNEKKHKCSECSYQTIWKKSLELHLNAHNNIKPFECDTCEMKFTQKSNLKMHILNQHSTSEKKYKCLKCFYQTNYKNDFTKHLIRHYNIKQFECDICKKKFSRKCTVKVHIENTHLKTNETK